MDVKHLIHQNIKVDIEFPTDPGASLAFLVLLSSAWDALETSTGFEDWFIEFSFC